MVMESCWAVTELIEKIQIADKIVSPAKRVFDDCMVKVLKIWLKVSRVKQWGTKQNCTKVLNSRMIHNKFMFLLFKG